VVALGGVVVDHVQDHLDAGGVQPAHHLLELADLLAVVARVRVAAGGREEVDGAVAPVVAQPLLDQEVLVDDLVDRQQLDGGDAERLQVLDDRGVANGGVGAADLLRHLGVEHREPLDVRLVDDRLVPGDAWAAVALPVERGVDHHALRHAPGAVLVVEDPVLPGLVEGVGEGVAP
jgi:hypothetical protein